jgi:carbonyl reductase 1
VINNASIALDGFDAGVVKQTLHPNYHGTLAATAALLPLLRPGGRLVNVTSTAGSLSKFSPSLQRRFRAARKAEDVDALMAEFLAAVEREEASGGRGGLEGWPRSAYAVSKAGATAATGCVARGVKESGGAVLVNACCPGWVKVCFSAGRLVGRWTRLTLS